MSYVHWIPYCLVLAPLHGSFDAESLVIIFRLANGPDGFQLMIASIQELAMLGLALFLEKMENDSELAVLKLLN